MRKVFKPEDMSPYLLVKSSQLKYEGPAVSRASFLDLRISGVSRIWLWKWTSFAIANATATAKATDQIRLGF
jgi:hypothetical protein